MFSNRATFDCQYPFMSGYSSSIFVWSSMRFVDRATAPTKPLNPSSGTPFEVTNSRATGTAERDMGLELVKKERKETKGRLNVAADKNYDTKDFVKGLRAMTVTPHVARKDKYSAIDGRTTTWEGYAQSQKKRKLVEEAFGWMKTVGLLHKLRHRGEAKARWVFQFTAAAYNLVRMRSLLGECVTG